MPATHTKPKRAPPKLLIAVILLGAAALAARVAAPVVVKHYVNLALADMGEYTGSVTDVDLFLLGGGYRLRNVRVVKLDSGPAAPPFIEMPTMELSLQWRALFHGRAVGEAVMFEPVVNLVQAESTTDKQLGTGVNWPQEVRDLFPFKLNSVEALNGLVTFRAPGIATDESLTVRDFHLLLHNLTNVQAREAGAFADLALDGKIMGNAPIELTGRFDPNAAAPTFDVDLTLEGARLVDVNPWLDRFLKADAESGVFSMYSELASADGRFEGYVKPILEDPKFFDVDEASRGPFRKAWEALVNLAAKILENRAANQVATEIPISGQYENPRVSIVEAIVNLLRNAFVAAFAHSLEGTITLRDVAGDVRTLGGAGAASEPSENEP
ncbi:MAG TPA: DUF748 domain-containing protein [Gammaproteobacteria bacterium]|nr:DUF748 domain-containing protein [Gammaproteobacteria bacterium]